MRSRVAQLITERARGLGHAAGAALECLSHDEAICLVAVGSLEHLDNSRRPLDCSFANACARSASPLLCNDIETDPRVDVAVCREHGIRTLLSVAAVSRPDETFVLSIVNGDHDFSHRDVHTLEVLTDLLATSAAAAPAASETSALMALGESGYQQVLDAIRDMVLVKGPRSRILWANKAFREVYGMSNEQLRGIIDSPSSAPDITQKYVQNDAYVFETGKTLDIPDEPVKQHDGDTRSYHTVKSAIFDVDGRVVMTVGVSRDISERKLLDIELRSAQKLESIGRLAAGIAHEINTPIQFIADNTNFLRTGFDDLLALYARSRALCEQALQARLEAADWSALMRAEDKADLAFIQVESPKAFASALRGVYHVTRVVNAMRTFAHPDPSDGQPLNVNQLLEVTLTIAAYQVRDVADVETNFGDVPLVSGYPNALNQVFLNLLINAAHAIGDVVSAGGARGRIRVRTYREGHDVVVSISDTGPGIPVELQSRVFEPFFTTKEVGLGKGYGLMFARAIIVEKHHGQIAFDSIPGEGTTFLVHLPIDPDASHP